MGHYSRHDSIMSNPAVAGATSVTNASKADGLGVAPPSGNTGVLTALADAFCISFPDSLELFNVLLLLGPDGWVPMPRGDLGYRRMLKRGNLCILFDGMPGMGIHVSGMGKACRELEGRSDFQGWPAFFDALLGVEGHFTRLDLAIDVKSTLVTIGRIRRALQRKTVVTPYRSWEDKPKKDPHTGAMIRDQINLGSRKSDSMIRAYDKALEQGVGGPWVRVELELHDGQAQRAASLLAEGVPVGELAASILYRKLDFKKKGTAMQKERWPTCHWWAEFIGGVQKLQLSSQKAPRTLESCKHWLLSQVASVLALARDAEGGESFLNELLEAGRQNMKPWQVALLKAAEDGPDTLPPNDRACEPPTMKVFKHTDGRLYEMDGKPCDDQAVLISANGRVT